MNYEDFYADGRILIPSIVGDKEKWTASVAARVQKILSESAPEAASHIRMNCAFKTLLSAGVLNEFYLPNAYDNKIEIVKLTPKEAFSLLTDEYQKCDAPFLESLIDKELAFLNERICENDAEQDLYGLKSASIFQFCEATYRCASQEGLKRVYLKILNFLEPIKIEEQNYSDTEAPPFSTSDVFAAMLKNGLKELSAHDKEIKDKIIEISVFQPHKGEYLIPSLRAGIIDPNFRSNEGKTIFECYFADSVRIDTQYLKKIVGEVCAAGGDIDLKFSNKDTLFICLCKAVRKELDNNSYYAKNTPENFNVLLEHGADPCIKDRDGFDGIERMNLNPKANTEQKQLRDLFAKNKAHRQRDAAEDLAVQPEIAW